MLELQKRPGAYVVAHDNGWRLPEVLHDGRQTGVERFDSEAQVREVVRAGRARGIMCVPSPDAGPVVSIAEDCAGKSLEAHEGERGYPGLVLIDEIVAAGGCRPNFLAPYMTQLLTLRRHKNVGCIWTCQSARLVHNQLLSMATRLYIFQLTDGKDLARLEEAGVSPEVLDRVRTLPKYEHVDVSFG